MIDLRIKMNNGHYDGDNEEIDRIRGSPKSLLEDDQISAEEEGFMKGYSESNGDDDEDGDEEEIRREEEVI